jgi:hypothetical protein
MATHVVETALEFRSEWTSVLDETAAKRFRETEPLQQLAMYDEANRYINCTREFLYHLRDLDRLRSVDPYVRAPFLVPQELDRLLTESRDDGLDHRSDLLPNTLVDMTNQFIAEIHHHGNPLFGPMAPHGLFMGQSVLEWYIRSTIHVKEIICHRRLTAKMFGELLRRLMLRYQESRATPGDLATARSVMVVCEPHQQGILNLRHTLNKLISNTEGIPRFTNLVGLTLNPNDFTLTCRLRTEAHTPRQTGYALLWDQKPGLTEGEKVVAHFQQVEPVEIFKQVLAVDYEADLEGLRVVDQWRPFVLDGDSRKWAYPHLSRFAFCLVMDVQAMAKRGIDVSRVLQRTRLLSGYMIVNTCRVSKPLSCARLYGQLLAVEKDAAKRMKQAEEPRLRGERITTEHLVHQYSSQRDYLRHVGEMVAEHCLPKTGIKRVSWDAKTRTARFLFHKSVHHVSYLRQFCSRPEIEPQSVRFGDIQLTAQYFGIQVARQMLKDELLATLSQYVTPFAGDLVAAAMTCAGRLVPLDYRSFQQLSNADSLTKGVVTRGKAAAQEAAREGVRIPLNRGQTAFMFGCPAPVGPDFQRPRLDTSHTRAEATTTAATAAAAAAIAEQETKESFLKHHDRAMANGQPTAWDPRWDDYFGRDDFHEVFAMQRGQYELFPMQSHPTPKWVGLELEPRFLFHKHILQRETDLHFLDTRANASFECILEQCHAVAESLVGQAARVYATQWAQHESLLLTRDPATTEVEARLVTGASRFSLDVDRPRFQKLVKALSAALGTEPIVSQRTDSSLLQGETRLRVETDPTAATESVWCQKKRTVPLAEVDEGAFRLRLSIMDEHVWKTADEKRNCELNEVFQALVADKKQTIRTKTRHSFDLDGLVTLVLDEVTTPSTDLADPDPKQEFFLEMELQPPPTYGLTPVVLYVFLKYALLLSSFVTLALHHEFRPDKSSTECCDSHV